MNAHEAEEIRTKWKESGSPLCRHDRVQKEKTNSGLQTGRYLCLTCGVPILPLNFTPVHALRR